MTMRKLKKQVESKKKKITETLQTEINFINPTQSNHLVAVPLFANNKYLT